MEAQIERYLHDSIPLTKALGLRVRFASPERVLLECPLEPNINHHGTAFGGSIAAVATLAGWTWIHVFMRERKLTPKLVISESHMQYLAPVEDDFTAELRAPGEAEIKAFSQTYDRRGSARIELKVSVLCQGEEVALFRGTYVALKA
ncbi:MAG: thioesterase domain-containing protein [Armatimonadetes bacterium]|nr:thioesterase [Armatimonadota bacterium]MBS1702330.1 thioesterase domain-containing protein [Armatimonadota bacterium]MBS1727181.1 thioesterase domain-containing protein [Armatimonadota bacterium]